MEPLTNDGSPFWGASTFAIADLSPAQRLVGLNDSPQVRRSCAQRVQVPAQLHIGLFDFSAFRGQGNGCYMYPLVI